MQGCKAVAASTTAGTAMAIPLFGPPFPETFFVSANLTEQYCKLQLKQIPYLVILTNTHWLYPSVINIFFLYNNVEFKMELFNSNLQQ